MLLTVFSICAILVNGMDYDCSEKWVIYIYDDPDVFRYCYPGAKEFHWGIKGCATWDKNRGYHIILADEGIGVTDGGVSLISHEIKHLQCLCNYHANPPEKPKR